MISIRVSWTIIQVIVFLALLIAGYQQHIRLEYLRVALSEEVQATRRSNIAVISTGENLRGPHRAGVTATTEQSMTKEFAIDGPLKNPLDVWIQNVRRLSDFAERNPELMIPHISLLQEQDWLDIGRGEFESEADFKLALAKLRDLARRKAAPDIGHALKAAINAAGGRTPNSPRDLIPYLPVGFNVAILDQMSIDPFGPFDERIPTSRFVLFERPVDGSDQPLAFNTIGSTAPRKPIAYEETAKSK